MSLTVDALGFLKVVLDRDRLAVVGLVCLQALTLEELGARTGLRRRQLLATLGPLVQAGIVERRGQAYALRAEALRELALDLPEPQPPARELLYGMTEHEGTVLARFFRRHRLVDVPAQRSKRRIVLERIALDFEPGVRYPEAEVNRRLRRYHDDHAALRRYLVDEGFLDRAEGCYWRSGGRVP